MGIETMEDDEIQGCGGDICDLVIGVGKQFQDGLSLAILRGDATEAYLHMLQMGHACIDAYVASEKRH